MNTDMLLSYLENYNEHELFYRQYQEKKQDPHAFQSFLNSLDLQYVRDNYLVLPERQLPVASDDVQTMAEQLYFRMDSEKSVYLSKHNRYTPPFLHTHTFFEVIYVLKGTCQHCVASEEHLLLEGDLCLISPSVTHSIYADGNSIVLNILIRRSNIEDIFFHVLRDHNLISDFLANSIYIQNYATYLTFHTHGDEDLKKQILEMYLEQFDEDSYSDRIISSMLIIFFARLVRKYKRTAKLSDPHATSEPAARLLHLILEQYATITLKEMASLLNYSIPYCSRYIKEVTGCSFQQLLKKIRFQKAESYLRNTSYSVYKISELLGYENPENFMRAFKREYGISPSQYRQSRSTL